MGELVTIAEASDSGDGEGARAAKIGEGERDGGPRGVLCEVGAENDLKTGVGRPPVLRAIGVEECVVDFAQALGVVEVRAHVR